MRFKFVHAADLHLDSPFRGLSADPRLRARFQDATFSALRRICDLCLRERVSFLVLAGDLYDAKDRSVRARLALRQQLGRLHDAGIRTFIVHGNHDPLSGDDGALGLPPSVKVFGASWEECEVRVGGQFVCRVQGVSYAHERVTEDLSCLFRRTSEDFTLGLLHANVGGASEHANYAPCTTAELSQRGLDYWALGHVHAHQVFALDAGGVAVYPGTPQGRHAQEVGEKGCVLVEVDGRVARPRFFATDVIRWHRVEVDLAGMGRLDELETACVEQVVAACSEGADSHAVRLVLAGRGPLHGQLARLEGAAALEDHLREELLARASPILLESVVDSSAPPVDLQAWSRAGGLAGAVWEAFAGAQANPGRLEELLGDEELARLDAALRRAQLRPTRDSAALLLERGMARALELLVEESP